MLIYQTSILNRILPSQTFEKLRLALQQMAKSLGEGAVILTEDILSALGVSPDEQTERFTVLVSPGFSVLLVGKIAALDDSQFPELRNGKRNHYLSPLTSELSSPIQVGLTFVPEAIATFLNQLSNTLKHNRYACLSLDNLHHNLQPNDPTLQSEFTLLLMEIISGNDIQASLTEPIYPYASVCQPVEDALSQQVEQERLLNQVTTQIRKSLELPVILETAVEQVRELLQVDRLLIYQFDDLEVDSDDSEVINGRITYESRASLNIPSVLNIAESQNCVFHTMDGTSKYTREFILAAEDIENLYAFSPCLLELMQNTQVRAKLVVPIIVKEKVWGLLIAHQCFEPRQWKDKEKTFLQHIAEHLALAIYQAKLYGQLQQEKTTLEQRVIERTQALQDALLAAQAASKSKSEFLATISHELRTPLTSIIGLSSTLLHWSFNQKKSSSETPQPALSIEKQQKYLQTIHDRGEHLLELINSILELSQVEASKAVLNISEFCLDELANESVESLAEKAKLKGVDVTIDLKINDENACQETEDIKIKSSSINNFIADAQRLKQIIINLVSNAIKFTHAGGKVILRVWREANTAIFQVEDTGIGISEQQLPLIFEKFQQLESSYQRSYEGMGLGLALTKHLVELHGGRIEVESIVGAGSTFTVYLPAQPVSVDS